MVTIHPKVTGGTVGEHLEPLAVSPKTACKLLSIGNTRFYQLLAAGELESYRDGRVRRVTMRSINARIVRLLAAEDSTGAATSITSTIKFRSYCDDAVPSPRAGYSAHRVRALGAPGRTRHVCVPSS